MKTCWTAELEPLKTCASSGRSGRLSNQPVGGSWPEDGKCTPPCELSAVVVLTPSDPPPLSHPPRKVTNVPRVEGLGYQASAHVTLPCTMRR